MTPISVADIISTRIKDIDKYDPLDQDKLILDNSTAHDMLAAALVELAMFAGMFGDEIPAEQPEVQTEPEAEVEPVDTVEQEPTEEQEE